MRRFFEKKEGGTVAVSDVIYDESTPISGECVAFDPLDATRRWKLDEGTPHQDLLVPIFRQGRRVGELPDIHASQQATRQNLLQFSRGIKRFVNPHLYRVGIEGQLQQTKTRLILEARQK